MRTLVDQQALNAFADARAGGPSADPSLDGPILVAVPGDRHAFVIGVASGLGREGLLRSVADMRTELDRFDGSLIRSHAPAFDPDGVVHRFVVYGGPLEGPPPAGPGVQNLHVEDLAEAILQANQTEAGWVLGQDYLWQFLEELAVMPGVADLMALEFGDVLRHWLEYGVLNAGGQRDIILHPNPLPDDGPWRSAAAWEPFEAVLATARLPSSWQWFAARLQEENYSEVTHFRHLCQVVSEPPLVIHAEVNPAFGETGIDPAIVLGIADGLQLTARSQPDVSSGLACAPGMALQVHLFLDHLRDTPREQGARVGFAVGSPPRPSVALRLGSDWFELLASDPRAAHNLFGKALAGGLARATGLAGAARKRFLAGWRAAPPVMLLHVREGPLGPARRARGNLPRSPATKARARRTLAMAALARGIRPGVRVGAGARTLCSDHVLPAAIEALEAVVGQWPSSAITTVAEHLNDAYAERTRDETELALALGAPWGAHWQRAALDRDPPSERTRPLELVAELLLSRPDPYGPLMPDRFDVAEAADLASEALTVGTAVSAASARLHDLAVLVDHGGIVRVSGVDAGLLAAVERSRVAIDMEAYAAADRADRLRLTPGSIPENPPGVAATDGSRREEQPFVRLRDVPEVPGSLLALDAVLKQEVGTGFDGINAVLATAVTTWSSGGDVAEVDRDELRREVMAWSGMPAMEIDAALERLVLEPAALRAEGPLVGELERRRHRLATRPLIAVRPGAILILPYAVQATQSLYAAYLLDGRLPWPPADIPRRVQDAVTRYRRVANSALERDATAIVRSLGLPHRARIRSHEAAGAGLVIKGEIDLLVADESRGLLWICEVKDVGFAASPATIATRVDKFVGKDGYIAQLDRAAGAVRANPTAAARLLHVADPDRTWEIATLMVTRRVEPAAFAAGVSATFVVVADLKRTLTAVSPPTEADQSRAC